MISIHFLRRSSGIFWISALIFTVGWTGLNPIDGYAANYEGLYSGVLNGEQSGTWFLQIDDSGDGQIYFLFTTQQVIDRGKVNINDPGDFTFKCAYGLSGSGSIKTDGNITGNWKLNSTTGAFNGKLQDRSELKNIAGTYSSSCTGNESGQLILIVAQNGSISGTLTWDKNGLVEEGSGAVNSKGNFLFHTQDDTSVFGTFKAPEAVSGHWNNPFWETKGTLGDGPAVKTTSSADSEAMPVYVESQENDSNGCFIRTATPN